MRYGCFDLHPSNTFNLFQDRSQTIDLADQSLSVDISDALSEKDKVKFTVHSKVRWYLILIMGVLFNEAGFILFFIDHTTRI